MNYVALQGDGWRTPDADYAVSSSDSIMYQLCGLGAGVFDSDREGHGRPRDAREPGNPRARACTRSSTSAESRMSSRSCRRPAWTQPQYGGVPAEGRTCQHGAEDSRSSKHARRKGAATGGDPGSRDARGRLRDRVARLSRSASHRRQTGDAILVLARAAGVTTRPTQAVGPAWCSYSCSQSSRSLAFGAGFVIHWLFIVAAVVALVWLISLFTWRLGPPRMATLVDAGD